MHWRLRDLLARIIHSLAPFKPVLECVCELEAAISRARVAAAHRRLMWVQWRIPPQPENFDHHIDLFYWWRQSSNPQWLERGWAGVLALKGGDVLELCCGDGFNARHFYSHRSRRIVACDFNARAIAVAKRKNHAPNVSFLVADIRKDMPRGVYENVVWDEAIEHFTEKEIESVLLQIKSRLTPDGILSGHTVLQRADGRKQLSHHEYEFKSKEDLLRFFKPHFKSALVFETRYPDRHNLTFWASDGVIPFVQNWPDACRIESGVDAGPGGA